MPDSFYYGRCNLVIEKVYVYDEMLLCTITNGGVSCELTFDDDDDTTSLVPIN